MTTPSNYPIKLEINCGDIHILNRERVFRSSTDDEQLVKDVVNRYNSHDELVSLLAQAHDKLSDEGCNDDEYMDKLWNKLKELRTKES